MMAKLNTVTTSEEKEMRLLTGVNQKDLVVFKLTQDGEEVNIYANDVLIGYFAIYNDKVTLFRCVLPTELFDADKDGYIKVVR